MLDPSQYWPTNDAWAYHDFHSMQHGPVKDYIKTMERGYGPATSLEDFARRIQMVNYVWHRDMLEAWNSKMWNPATGLLLWMTHPAWPSTVWQIYSSDYDTHASFYGFEKAAEPLHVQWNLDTDEVAVVNHLYQPLHGTTVKVTLADIDGRQLLSKSYPVDAAPAQSQSSPKSPGRPDPAPLTFMRLEWLDVAGKRLSDNFYWCSQKFENQLALNNLPQANLQVTLDPDGSQDHLQQNVTVANKGTGVALMVHLTLRNQTTGARILPAFYSDNYISLLPGETRIVTVSRIEKDATAPLMIGLDGWNLAERSVSAGKGN